MVPLSKSCVSLVWIAVEKMKNALCKENCLPDDLPLGWRWRLHFMKSSQGPVLNACMSAATVGWFCLLWHVTS